MNLAETSLGDVLGNADPWRNAMDWIESQDEFRREHPDVVEAALKSPKTGKVNLMRSAGPVSDRYIFSQAPASLICGPGGSGKTIASAKKCLVEAQRMRPGADGFRRYVVGTWRQKYVNVWKATIPSWWKLFPRDLPGSKWSGASPREAEHVVKFTDKYGLIEFTNRFRAFGETMDPDDVLGNEFTDCYLNEWTTLPEELFIALVDRVGRDPPREITGRTGRFFGDSNAPDVTSYIYRDFFETPRAGYVLYKQPGGLHPDAENIEAVGREYYLNSAAMNAHRPWWIKRMINAQPGFTRASDPVYPKFDDARNISPAPLPVFRELPVGVGCDGGLTPAAVYVQETSAGQLRVIAEIQLARGGMRELATAMLALEARRFAGNQLVTVCDPAMGAGEDTEEGSDRSRLAAHLAREIALAPTQDVGARIEAVSCKFDLTMDDGIPGLIVDPSCKALRRGFNQTYHFRPIAGSDDRGQIAKTFDGHPHDALQYIALMCGAAKLRRTVDEIAAARARRKEAAANRGRYDPYRTRREGRRR